MTQRPDILRLSLGAQAEQHKAALMALVADLGIHGRNNVPSLSELVSRIATAYRHAPDRTATAIGIIIHIAAEAEQRDPMVRDADGRITGVRLHGEDGRPFTLADARAANPAEFWQFAAAAIGGDEEE
jgi:hypothetical protein